MRVLLSTAEKPVATMSSQKKQTKDVTDRTGKKYNYSLCRSSCSVCPYRTGLLKLLDHGIKIVPTLPESDN